MKDVYTSYFLMGGTLNTMAMKANSVADAASQSSADIKGIAAPGYNLVPDSHRADFYKQQAEMAKLENEIARLKSENEDLGYEILEVQERG